MGGLNAANAAHLHQINYLGTLLSFNRFLALSRLGKPHLMAFIIISQSSIISITKQGYYSPMHLDKRYPL